MKKDYKFRVEVTCAQRQLKEKIYPLCLDDSGAEKLCQAAKEVKEVVVGAPDHELLYPNNLCDFDSLNDIYRKIYVQWLNDEGLEDIHDVTQEDIDKLKKCGCSLKIEFPPEVLYPYIWTQDKYFTMGDCFPQDGLVIEKPYELDEHMDYFQIAKLAMSDPYGQYNNFDRTCVVNELDDIFTRFDSPMLYHLSIEHKNRQDEIMPLMSGVICNYLYKHKLPYSCFGFTYYNNLRKHIEKANSDLPGISYPEFGKKARLALLYNFFIQKWGNTSPNTLKYQLNPKFVEITEDGDELEIDNYMESFSEIDGWYYEMCTGLTLSLAVSAQLYEFSKTKSDDSSLWADFRLPVWYKILGIYYPLIVSCPAVYWRISMLQKVIQRVDDEMKKPEYEASPNKDDTARNEAEWFQAAHDSFCRAFKVEFTHRLGPFNYQATLKQFPQILILQACFQRNNSERQDCQNTFKYDPFVYCTSNDNYTPKVRDAVLGIQNNLRLKPNHEELDQRNNKSTRIRNDVGGEYAGVFEKVRNALYPGGFVDFQA